MSKYKPVEDVDWNNAEKISFRNEKDLLDYTTDEYFNIMFLPGSDIPQCSKLYGCIIKGSKEEHTVIRDKAHIIKSIIGNYVYLERVSKITDGTKCGHHVKFDGFDEIEDNVKFGDYNTLDGSTKVGKNAQFGNNCLLGAPYHYGGYRKVRNLTVGENAVFGKNTKIRHRCTIGDNSVFHPGIRVYSDVKFGNNCIFHVDYDRDENFKMTLGRNIEFGHGCKIVKVDDFGKPTKESDIVDYPWIHQTEHGSITIF